MGLDAQAQSWSTTATMTAHCAVSKKVDLDQRATSRLFVVVAAALALFVGIGTRATPAYAAKKESAKSRIDARELQAREAFASGHYPEALQLRVSVVG